MPSEIANTIVNHIFADEKSKAIDATNDALSASAYDAIQAKSLSLQKSGGLIQMKLDKHLLMKLRIKSLMVKNHQRLHLLQVK